MIEGFVRFGFGWLTPGNKLLACSPFSHRKTIIYNCLEVNKYIPWIQSEYEKLLSLEKDCAINKNMREGNNWNIFESEKSRIEQNISNGLFNGGFVRLGINQSMETIEAEGQRDRLHGKLDRLKKITSEYNIYKRLDFRLKLCII